LSPDGIIGLIEFPDEHDTSVNANKKTIMIGRDFLTIAGSLESDALTLILSLKLLVSEDICITNMSFYKVGGIQASWHILNCLIGWSKIKIGASINCVGYLHPRKKRGIPR
jgi:hypothetical protein